MTSRRVTFVHHYAIDIACAPSTIWDALLKDVGRGEGFASAGYQLWPLDEPSVPLGGYRMRLGTGDVEDERICRITERDDDAMRLSMWADYLSTAADNMVVYATYQAVPADGNAQYRLDCHATLDVDMGAGASAEDMAQRIAALHDTFQQGISGSVARFKAKLESARTA